MKNILFLMMVLFANKFFAQSIEVKNFNPLEKDQTAVTSPRKDINGITCGLVKVDLKEPGAEFDGNVMGNVQFTGTEYMVYLPNGTKRLGIKHPDYLPTTIVFADYGIKRIASNTTYQLKVKTNKKKVKVDNSKKGTAVFNIKPSNAVLLIDGQIANGSDGAYILPLPFGIHYYTVKLKGFSLNNQVVQVDKNAKTINVDLTEFFAKIEVSCQTEDAVISINGEQKGIGRWSNKLIPGKYTVEVSKNGYHSQTRQINLCDNDTMTIDFSKLKAMTGDLCVNYEPKGSDVLLNGKKVGVTPLVLKNLPIGDYHLEIRKEYYLKMFTDIKITEDREWKEQGELGLTPLGKLLLALDNRTYEHGWYSIDNLAHYYRYGTALFYQGMIECFERDSLIIPINPVKAVAIYKIVIQEMGSTWLKELEPCYPSTQDDAKLSFCWARYRMENELDSYSSNDRESHVKHSFLDKWLCEDCPYPALAWHYFYGIGCDKNKEEAKRLIRCICSEKGEYCFPALIQLIKDMGLEKELKYNPEAFND